jgi:hypothetical protein
MLIRGKVLAALNDMTYQTFAGITLEEMETTKKVIRKVLKNAR